MYKKGEKVILDEIFKKTREDLKRRKKMLSFELLGRSLSANPYMPRDVIKALKSTPNEPFKLICEIKKASPSKGVIREYFKPVEIAREYEKAEADAFSVLTEPHFFKGDLEFISQIRRYTKTPILRKDFIIDEYQILEALVYGADFVLLIAKALSLKELKKLLEFTHHIGLEALVEIHDKKDLLNATLSGANIIGINHRDLNDFSLHMNLAEELVPLIPNGKIIVAESGLNSREQLVNLNKVGVDAFLIGEHFMRQNDICAAVREMKGV